MPFCNGQTFQLFLNEFSLQNPEELKIVILDNGAFHKANKLIIPENIILIFLPPYSPELNPAEKIWAKFKRDFSNRLFKSLDDLDQYLCTIVKTLTINQVISTCSFGYVFFDKFWTKL
jgi:transposase